MSGDKDFLLTFAAEMPLGQQTPKRYKKKTFTKSNVKN
jgi:hypothetical protein